MAQQAELLPAHVAAEGPHIRDQVFAVVACFGFAAVAMAAQVGGNDVVVFAEALSQAGPHTAMIGQTVEQQEFSCPLSPFPVSKVIVFGNLKCVFCVIHWRHEPGLWDQDFIQQSRGAMVASGEFLDMVSKKAQKARAKTARAKPDRVPALLRHFLTRQTLRKTEMIQALELAFAGVVLGDGVSLRQAAVFDSFGQEPFDLSDPDANVVDDWRLIPHRELNRNNTGYLDPEGWRYYWPAMAIALLDDYGEEQDGLGDLRIIGTLMYLDRRKRYLSPYEHDYTILTLAQKCAIALYLQHLPSWVELNISDVRLRRRALKNYWNQFLVEVCRPTSQ